MKAIYPGSFNPWTKGHQDILERALTIFDEVMIVVAKNPKKKLDPEFIKWTLRPVVSEFNDKVSVIVHDGLVSELGCTIIRGVRPGDWEYEQNLALWNKELGVETVFMCSNPGISHFNSSALRDLHSRGVDINKYAGNELCIERWKQGSIPKNNLHAGKISIGKSTWLPSNVIDGDKRFKHYFDSELFEKHNGCTLSESLKKIISSDDPNRKIQYKKLLENASEYIDWKGFFKGYASFEVPALGMWWEFIPKSILARFYIVELSTDIESRRYYTKKRGLSWDYINKIDQLYESPKVVDAYLKI